MIWILSFIFIIASLSFSNATYISAVYPTSNEMFKGEEIRFRIILNKDTLAKDTDEFQIYLKKDVSFFPDYKYAKVFKMRMQDLERAMAANGLTSNFVDIRCKNPNHGIQGELYFGFDQKDVEGKWHKGRMSDRMVMKKKRFWQIGVPLITKDISDSCVMLGMNNNVNVVHSAARASGVQPPANMTPHQ